MLKAVGSLQQQIANNENNSNVNFRRVSSGVRNDMPANDTFEKEGKKDKKTGLVVGGILLGLAALVTGIALKKGLKLNKAKKLAEKETVNLKFEKGIARDSSGRLYCGTYTTKTGKELTYVDGRLTRAKANGFSKEYKYNSNGELEEVFWCRAGQGHCETRFVRKDGKIVSIHKQTFDSLNRDIEGLIEEYVFEQGKRPKYCVKEGFLAPKKEYLVFPNGSSTIKIDCSTI